MIAGVVAVNPLRMTPENKRARALTIALTAVILVTNLIALVALLHALVSSKFRPRRPACWSRRFRSG